MNNTYPHHHIHHQHHSFPPPPPLAPYPHPSSLQRPFPPPPPPPPPPAPPLSSPSASSPPGLSLSLSSPSSHGTSTQRQPQPHQHQHPHRRSHHHPSQSPPTSPPLPVLPSLPPEPYHSNEIRTLMTFPTDGVPSPRILPMSTVRSFNVRYPPVPMVFSRPGAGNPGDNGSTAIQQQHPHEVPQVAPFQTQTNRWLCCQCADQGRTDPIGTVHLEEPPPHPYYDFQIDTSYILCWRPDCGHEKCVNCALYPGPGSRERVRKAVVRTVGGLHGSPRFLDPVYWECGACGEWKGNAFNWRSVLGRQTCGNVNCSSQKYRWGARGRGGGPQAEERRRDDPFFPRGQEIQREDGGRGDDMMMGGAEGEGVLFATSVVMNRYGQRLGSADQRMAIRDGPWDWQRRALGDTRCALLKGVRDLMKRVGPPGDNPGDGFYGGRGNNERVSSLMDSEKVWKEGQPVPNYGYRRPPPLDGNDAKENDEYERSYLSGIPVEPMSKGKAPERVTYGDGNGGTGPTASLPASQSQNRGAGRSPEMVDVNGRPRLFSGWDHLQM